jgi:PAS domain S-box-containing protein
MTQDNIPYTGSHRHLVIVDDDRNLTNLISRRIRKEQIQCTQFSTGEEALAYFSRKKDALLLLDNRLSDFSGREIIQKLHDQNTLPHFIIMTGQGDERLAVEMMKYGASDYLVKDLGFLDQLPGVVKRAFYALETQEKLARTEEALLQSEGRFRSLFLNVPVSIYIMDRDTGEIIDCNPQGYKIYGLSSVEELKNNDIWLAPPYSRQDALRWNRKAAEEGPQQFEWLNRSVNGKFIWEQIRINSVKINGVDRVLVTGTDITKQKNAQVEKEKLQAQLIQAQKMESVGRLAGGVAHDFNNMLGGIMGYTELMQQKLKKEDPLQSDLEEMKGLIDRSARLTQQLLAFARKDMVTPETIAVNTAVQDILKMLKRVINERITIQWKPCEEELHIYFDPSQLDQIIMNLCINAQDAMDKKGTITLSTYIVQKKSPEDADRSYCVISVADTGSGMSEEIRNYIFEPFFTTKEAGKGTGLGLSTVYGIVQQNHGFIEVESSPGKGAEFKVFIPLHEQKPIEPSHREVSNTKAAHNKTVLLVEDNPAILATTKMILSHLGFSVICHENPLDALNYTDHTSHTIDLLLTDILMPHMDGKELADRIRKNHPEIRTVFMSGYAAEFLNAENFSSGGYIFIKKPFTINTLAQKLHEAFL